MGFSRQEYWSGLSFPSPEDLPDSGIKPWSPALQADSLLFELQGSPTKKKKKRRRIKSRKLEMKKEVTTDNAEMQRTKILSKQKIFTMYMETQKTSNSQSYLEKEQWSWKNQPS